MTPSHAELVALVERWENALRDGKDLDAPTMVELLRALLSRSPAREQGAVAIDPTVFGPMGMPGGTPFVRRIVPPAPVAHHDPSAGERRTCRAG